MYRFYRTIYLRLDADNDERDLQINTCQLDGSNIKRLGKYYLDVFTVIVRCHDLHDEMLHVSWNGLLANVLHQLAEFQWKTLLALHRTTAINRGIKKTDVSTYLLLSDERTPKHTDTLTDHAHIQRMLLPEPSDELLQRRVILELKTVPKRPLHTTVLALLRGDRLREPEERQSEIDETVLVVFELVLAVDDLVKLQAHQTSDQSGGRSDSRDDLTRDLLRRVTIRRVDTVVHRPQIRRGRNEVNMMVRVVVLLELHGVQAEPSKGRRGRKLLDEIGPVGTVAAAAVVLHRFVFVDLYFDTRPRREFGDDDAVSYLLEDGGVGLAA